jgi:hypothetical protein
MATMTDETRELALAEIHSALQRFHDGRSVNIPIHVIVCSGIKQQ